MLTSLEVPNKGYKMVPMKLVYKPNTGGNLAILAIESISWHVLQPIVLGIYHKLNFEESPMYPQ